MAARTSATTPTNPAPNRVQFIPALPEGRRRRLLAVQAAHLLDPIERHAASLRDGCKFVVELLGQARHAVALALQGHAQPQLRDDEVKQRVTLLDLRAGQRQHRLAEPASQGLDVGGHKACHLRDYVIDVLDLRDRHLPGDTQL